MKVDVGNNKHISVKVFRPLPHTKEPASVTAVEKLELIYDYLYIMNLQIFPLYKYELKSRNF